jgi:hypothetical protein
MGKKVVVAVRFELTTFAGALARKGSGQVSLPLHQPATDSTIVQEVKGSEEVEEVENNVEESDLCVL